jgi:hypothetical protein
MASSTSRNSFNTALSEAQLLVADLPRTGADSAVVSPYKQIRFRAHLAAVVASWESYIESVAAEYLAALGKRARKPLDSALHQLLVGEQERARAKFNTPNFENSRTYISRYTGLDVYPLWVWPAGGFATPIATQERLNQILTVRHSFAHGFSLPAFPWLESRPEGRFLSVAVCKKVANLFAVLVVVTDHGLEGQLQRTLGSAVTW